MEGNTKLPTTEWNPPVFQGGVPWVGSYRFTPLDATPPFQGRCILLVAVPPRGRSPPLFPRRVPPSGFSRASPSCPPLPPFFRLFQVQEPPKIGSCVGFFRLFIFFSLKAFVSPAFCSLCLLDFFPPFSKLERGLFHVPPPSPPFLSSGLLPPCINPCDDFSVFFFPYRLFPPP